VSVIAKWEAWVWKEAAYRNGLEKLMGKTLAVAQGVRGTGQQSGTGAVLGGIAGSGAQSTRFGCIDFFRGLCSRGVNCRNEHSDQAKCPRGSACPFQMKPGGCFFVGLNSH